MKQYFVLIIALVVSMQLNAQVCERNSIKFYPDSQGYAVNAVMGVDGYAEYVEFNSASYPKLLNAVSRCYKNDFDFIFVLDAVDHSVQRGAAGLHFGTSNDVEGIGLGNFNSNSDFGTASRVKGVIDMPYPEAMDGGPNLHEVAHQFGVFISPELLKTAYSFAHWGFTDAGGVLGGWQRGTLQQVGENTYNVRGPNPSADIFFPASGFAFEYSDWELYLMGLIPKSQLQPLTAANDYVEVSQDFGKGNTFTASSFTTFSVEEIIQDLGGDRVPSYLDSQKNFNALVVITSATFSPDELAMAAEDSLTFMAEEPGSTPRSNPTFFQAARGLARFNTQLAISSLRLTSFNPALILPLLLEEEESN